MAARSLVLSAAVTAALAVLAGCDGSSGGPSATEPAPAVTSSPASSAASGGASTGATTGAADPAPRDWPTYHGDAARTGVHPGMPAPSGRPRVVASLKLDAAVYASPIVVGGTVVVATENNSLYAFTTDGRQLWRRAFGDPARRSDLPCGNIDPSGITGTPVYSPATGLVYAVTEHANPVRHDLVAVDLRTGTPAFTRALPLTGTAQDAMQQRGALTVTGGRVWVPWGGRAGDCGDYKGTVVGVPLSGQGAEVSYTVPTTREAGIWTPPGPSVDSSGRLYVAVGNGESGPGDPYDHSDSVLALSPQARLVDSFSPSTWAQDNAVDADLGSQGPALVGPWVFAAGKSGTAYVLRRDRLGGIGGEVSSTSLCRSFGGTAVAGDTVYVPCTDGLRAVRIGSNGQLTVLWHAASELTGSPVVGGGRVWTLDTGAGVLHALDPATGASTEQIAVGAVTRFATPALYGADVLVGTQAGLVIVRP